MALILYILSLFIIAFFTIIFNASADTFIICLAILLASLSISSAILNKKK